MREMKISAEQNNENEMSDNFCLVEKFLTGRKSQEMVNWGSQTTITCYLMLHTALGNTFIP